MKKVIMVLAITLLLFAVQVSAVEVSLNLNGYVSDFGYYMGTGYTTPLFQIGDPLSVEVVYEDSTMELVSMQYTITTGPGSTFGTSMTNFSNYTTGVSEVDGGIFIYASNNEYLQNWSLKYGQTTDPDLFSYNQQHVEGQMEPYAYNFNSIPEPMTLALMVMGTALIGRTRERRSTK